MAFQLDSVGECWKMQSMCRDIFQAGGENSPMDRVAVALGTFSGLLCSLLVYIVIRGGLKNRGRNRNEDIEFTMVENDASID